MTCQRCHGLMVVDHYIDLQDDSGNLWMRAWRCISCGDVLDAQIRSRRLLLKSNESAARTQATRPALPLTA